MWTAWEIMLWLTQILCIFQYIFVPVCELHSVYTHKTLRNYTFYERYAASVYGVCQVYSNSICDYLHNDWSMARGSYFPHKAHASIQLGWKGNVWFTLILCAITYIMIRVWGKVAVSRTRPMRSDKWYEKYAAGMQGKFDIFSHFICNSLYNHTGKQSMRFTPPPLGLVEL